MRAWLSAEGRVGDLPVAIEATDGGEVSAGDYYGGSVGGGGYGVGEGGGYGILSGGLLGFG